MIEQVIKLAVQRAFFEAYFKNARQVRFGVWMTTLFGDTPVGDEIIRKVGLRPEATHFDYADALVQYAHHQGWGEELTRLMEEDLTEAYDDPRYRRYLKSRHLFVASPKGAS
jgi:hypothetical protein